jgi:hypothetical protein
LVTLSNTVVTFLVVAALCAPLFALWVVMDFRRALRLPPVHAARPLQETR